MDPVARPRNAKTAGILEAVTKSLPREERGNQGRRVERAAARERIARRLFVAAIVLLISAQFFPGAAWRISLELGPNQTAETLDWEVVGIGTQVWKDWIGRLPELVRPLGAACLIAAGLFIVATPWLIRPLRQSPGIRWMCRILFAAVTLGMVVWECSHRVLLTGGGEMVFGGARFELFRTPWPSTLTREFREGAWLLTGGLAAYALGLCVLPGWQLVPDRVDTEAARGF
ncbi:hypothetical protein [Luteolibacter sp. LG18]|uniref:hypothetical protein n=1 Tax=Luteolibacter sp. LG18 TaxID=2819286 RepID=UPI0030C6DF42